MNLRLLSPFSVALILFLLACDPTSRTRTSEPATERQTYSADGVSFVAPKNVILMIGDGMGITQITAGMYMNGNKLNLEKFTTIGLHKSYSADNLVTDSAAGATAFSAGIKTYNGAIGVDMDSNAVRTILEEAEQRGMPTGMVATSTIVHATPASFIAHQPSRKMYDEIAADFLNTEIDLFIGGGRNYFMAREDGRTLYQELEGRNYQMTDFLENEIDEVEIDRGKNFGYLTSNSDPVPAAMGRDYLVPASRVAVDFLEDRAATSGKGFFLMIEGSQIDWGGHSNESEYIISEMIDFDNAIGEVLKFADRDGETLVIVTADHETGGYAINPGSTMDTIVSGFTSDYHTAALIPVFAYGPGAELFAGIYENTAIYDKMRRAYGFDKEPLE